MADIKSPFQAPNNIDGYDRIGTNVWCDVMPGYFGPGWSSISSTDSAMRSVCSSLPLTVSIPTSSNDELVHDDWMSLQGIQSRQISFGLHHTITEQVEETHRKDVVFGELGRRFPSTLGIILDYDLVSSTGAYDFGSPSYHQGMIDRQKLLEQRWQKAWAQAQKDGATAADESRIHALFNAGIVAEMYKGAVAELHAAVPQQRVSSSITADHTTIDGGQYAPVEYGPLDFRYMEVWNDQVYPDSAHDMQESYWTDLLRQEEAGRSASLADYPNGRPAWHTRLRRSSTSLRGALLESAMGAEGSAGLTGGLGRFPEHPERALCPVKRRPWELWHESMAVG